MSVDAPPQLFGLAAEFESPEAILEAARTVVSLSYTHVEAYVPDSVEGLAETLGQHKTGIAPIVGAAALVGAGVGFAMQWFANAVHYPLNVGGRPPVSWPMFIPITFELAILSAAVSGVVAFFWKNRLPQPFHPMFRLEAFRRASRDRFFLCVEATDPRFDPVRTRKMLEALEPLAVLDVPA